MVLLFLIRHNSVGCLTSLSVRSSRWRARPTRNIVIITICFVVVVDVDVVKLPLLHIFECVCVCVCV